MKGICPICGLSQDLQVHPGCYLDKNYDPFIEDEASSWTTKKHNFVGSNGLKFPFQCEGSGQVPQVLIKESQ